MEALYSFRDGIVLKTTDLGGVSQLSVDDSYDFASNSTQIKVFEELYSVTLKIVDTRLAAEINLRNEKLEIFSITKIHDYFCDGKYWVPLNKGNLNDIKELLNEIRDIQMAGQISSEKEAFDWFVNEANKRTLGN